MWGYWGVQEEQVFESCESEGVYLAQFQTFARVQGIWAILKFFAKGTGGGAGRCAGCAGAKRPTPFSPEKKNLRIACT